MARHAVVIGAGMAGLLPAGGHILAVSYWPGSHAGGFLPNFAMGTNQAALEAMCRYFAVALAPRGITVNAVCPGITDDSIVNRLPPEAQEAMLARLRRGWTPMGRPGTPADVGGAVAALCTADAAPSAHRSATQAATLRASLSLRSAIITTPSQSVLCTPKDWKRAPL
jgi:NAD(P)-dependent dehydrogenase (short-subunit alcohol dehydrogenase family)